MKYWQNQKLNFWLMITSLFIAIIALIASLAIPFIFRKIYPPKVRIETKENTTTIITPTKKITVESTPGGQPDYEFEMKHRLP